MKLHQSIITILLVAFSSAIPAQESVKSIVEGYEAKKITDIENYVNANPEAEDLDEAYFFLANALGALGKHTQAISALNSRYALLPKGEDAPIQMILQEIVRPTMASSEALKDNSHAFKLIKQMRIDFSSHSKSADLDRIFNSIEKQLNRPPLPTVGETIKINFTATDGTEVDLAKMKGKVVLVDFWATWCSPCVDEIPHIVAAYEKHKESGFDVIGISLDKEQEKLENFIDQNNMPWVQYFDGAGFKNKIAKELGISGIPATFLIGKDGTIAATNLRGAALETAIVKALAAE